ncbi:PAS/PAC sensor signal transduction histidine kinase [Salsuginibacillus halophilus]|uniref:histidine kinase n=1 Tax=Salsuginibacillus halophilus TaxID=517424 RepID=A0A2P8HI72_9BACI|nr:cell wall metabolism sensor histidine kinase WalK [Salsuginibacillus halophilus]PSL45915.1 PAS/PAC sensor signal transduction histidine kinase [Salsuginibacillus halophilus]
MRVIGFFKSIHFKLIVLYVLLILIAMQIIGVYFTGQLEEQLISNQTETLEERADLLAYNVEQEMLENRGEDDEPLEASIEGLLNEFFSIEGSEAQVIDDNQVILGTSDMTNDHIVGQISSNVRVNRALNGTPGPDDILREEETNNRIRVMARPIESGNDILGAIYIESSMEEIYGEMNQINNILMTGTVIALSVTALLGIMLARTITRPIADMQKQARVMGEGDYSRRVRVFGNDEIGQLAHSFNALTRNLKEAHITTEGERKKLSSVLTHMTDGVIATDELGRIILMNKRAEELLEARSVDAMGHSLPDILRLSETLTPSDLYDYSEALLLDFSDENGEYLLEANFSVIRNEDGPITGLITVLHDVTDQEKLERERREFVANVSHELRTPLTTMKSYLEALEDGAMENEELAGRFLSVTQNETERMIRLVNDLLQLSKMDSNDDPFYFETRDFGTFLHEMADRYDMMFKDRGITMERWIPGRAMYVDFDSDKLAQVFDNIVSNALKYSPEGGTITLQADARDDRVVVGISDEGPGIPEENQEKVFERFYRVDKARARNLGGTGLGLAIAKEMVEGHGGWIDIESEYSRGTTLYVTLPYTGFQSAGVEA